MAKSSKDAYGAAGSTNLLMFEPETLKLIDDPKHPLYDKRVHRPLDEFMIASIMQFGVKEPVIVWKDPDSGDVCVVAGRQRVKNAVEANKRLKKAGELTKQIKAVVERGDPKNLMLIMGIENEGRSANTPDERADLAQRLLEAGHSEETIAVVLHCSKGTVKNYLAILESTGKVRAALKAGRIDPTTVYKLSKLHPAEQNAKLEEILEASGDTAPIASENETGIVPTKKKKRRKNAKKIREITNGSAGLRGKREVQKMLKHIAEFEKIKEANRIPLVAALEWTLGDDNALDAFM